MIIHDSKIRRARRVRAKLSINQSIPRLSVSRTNKHIWAQLIDDLKSITIAAVSTKSIATKGTKSEKAAMVGQEIAKKAKELKISAIRFDRGLNRYHGRVKALAESARKGGLHF